MPRVNMRVPVSLLGIYFGCLALSVSAGCIATVPGGAPAGGDGAKRTGTGDLEESASGTSDVVVHRGDDGAVAVETPEGLLETRYGELASNGLPTHFNVFVDGVLAAEVPIASPSEGEYEFETAEGPTSTPDGFLDLEGIVPGPAFERLEGAGNAILEAQQTAAIYTSEYAGLGDAWDALTEAVSSAIDFVDCTFTEYWDSITGFGGDLLLAFQSIVVGWGAIVGVMLAGTIGIFLGLSTALIFPVLAVGALVGGGVAFVATVFDAHSEGC